MANENIQFTTRFDLKSAELCSITDYKYMSGIDSAMLSAKKTAIYALNKKTKNADNDDEWFENVAVEAERKSLEHDIMKIRIGLKKWTMNENAFVDEVDNYDIDDAVIEKLRHEVLFEINSLIDNVHLAYQNSPTVDKKNETLPSTNLPTAASSVSPSMTRSSKRSTMSLTKPQ